MNPLPHRLMLRRREVSGTSRHGNEIRGAVDPIPCRGQIDWISAEENTQDRESTRRTANVMLEPIDPATAAELRSYDEIEWLGEGVTLKMQGTAQPVHDGQGRRSHFEGLAYEVFPK